MCDHSHPHRAPRHGSCLEHGSAHEADHRHWSRRGFLASLGAFSAGSFLLGSAPVRVFGASSFAERFKNADPNRILVLIQLRGGNDGLNTIVPFNDDLYYNLRPALAIPKEDAEPYRLNANLGMHPALAPLHPHFSEGRMAVLQNVGYPDSTLSHFRSTDIWVTASDADEVVGTGWLGRHLQAEHPGFDLNPPEKPLAVQIGGSVAQLFKGTRGDMGMMLTSTKVLDNLLAGGEIYDTTAVPATLYGQEMAFTRLVANNSFRYADAVRAAYDAGDNSIDYPDIEGKLGSNLATVARLIDGDLGAKIYHLTLIGFDTHSNQENTHANLLDILAKSIDAFLTDIASLDPEKEVLVMTYSEFGRRVPQNGSRGTDHGTAAPVLLFGSGLKGGVYGTLPNLASLDGGNLNHDIDFRSVYGTVLQEWFGIQRPRVVDALLGFGYTSLKFVANPLAVGVDDPVLPEGSTLHQNYPNPFYPSTTIAFSLSDTSAVRLEVYDVQGRRVRTLVDRTLGAGEHQVPFEAGSLPSGPYFYRLQTSGGVQTREMVLVR
jgi:uncharacterized protein (DUF1501 family)